MAETTTKSTKKETKKVHLPRARKGEERDLFVGVNGVNYIIPKGKEVEVPEFVWAEVERSLEAESKMLDNKEALLSRSK